MVKICGITRPTDAEAVVEAGADAMGLVFAAGSPRRVSVTRARELADLVGASVCRVGVFVDASVEEVRTVLDQVDLDLLQFHGIETPEYCEQFGLPYMKAIRVKRSLPMTQLVEDYAGSRYLLLDTHVDGVAGGTGRRFDWRLWPGSVSKPLVLAGGLTPANVADAVAATDPYGVDVSGGVEGPIKGEKNRQALHQFVRNAKAPAAGEEPAASKDKR